MNILILGSEGFIGNHLARYFISKKASVFGCDLFETSTLPYKYRKISRLSPELDEVFVSAQYSVCINAAGSGNVTYSMTHPFSDFEANSLDTIRVLDCIRRMQPSCKYIHISSAAVYGNPTKLPVTEQDAAAPLSPYGWHKLIAENICKEFTQVYGILTTIIRPFSVYGPHLRKQLFWDLYSKCIATNNNSIELWGTGNETRDFIHISDLVYLIEMLIYNAPMKGEAYNVGSGIETTISAVVNLFKEKFLSDMEISFNQQVREGDPLHWRADITSIQQLGFKQTVSLQKGIENLVLWLKSLA